MPYGIGCFCRNRMGTRRKIRGGTPMWVPRRATTQGRPYSASSICSICNKILTLYPFATDKKSAILIL